MIKILSRYFPSGLRSRIENRHGLSKVLNNIGWLFFDKILRLGLGLFVSIWVARYLGPEQFGLMSYALAFVSLFSAIAGFGLNTLAIRDLVQKPLEVDTTMGTAFALQFLGGLFAFGLALMAINIIRPGDEMIKFFVAILSCAMVFKSTDVVRYWFESQVESKFVVWTENVIFLVVSVMKLGLIFVKAPLMAFIWLLFFQDFFLACGLIGIYSVYGNTIRRWHISFSRARELFKDSWPLILSGLAVMVYMRIDQIMLGHMLGDDAVGVYTAAVRISEIWYFLPMVITASVFPSIIEAKAQSETLYLERLQGLFNLVVILALAVAIPMTFLSDWVVTALFGAAYRQAGSVLSIHIWAGLFVFLGVTSGRWFLVEGLQIYSFYRTLVGAVVNVGLNVVLIPKYGIGGAAWATVVSQACATMFFNIFNRRTRQLFLMQCRSCLFAGGFLKELRNIISPDEHAKEK